MVELLNPCKRAVSIICNAVERAAVKKKEMPSDKITQECNFTSKTRKDVKQELQKTLAMLSGLIVVQSHSGRETPADAARAVIKMMSAKARYRGTGPDLLSSTDETHFASPSLSLTLCRQLTQFSQLVRLA